MQPKNPGSLEMSLLPISDEMNTSRTSDPQGERRTWQTLKRLGKSKMPNKQPGLRSNLPVGIVQSEIVIEIKTQDFIDRVR